MLQMCRNMHLVIFTVILLIVNTVYMWQEKPGDYKIVMKALEQCPDSHLLPLKFNTKMSRYNRTVITYSGEINLPYDLDDSLSITIDIAKNGNGGYKENYYNVRLDNVCTMGKALAPHVIKDVFHSANVTIETCPLPKGKYYIKDYVINLGNVQGMPKAMYGEFKMELNYYKVHDNGTDEKISCMRGYYELKPK